jgi:phosphoenolpyruvate carboxykinase (ATP)
LVSCLQAPVFAKQPLLPSLHLLLQRTLQTVCIAMLGLIISLQFTIHQLKLFSCPTPLLPGRSPKDKRVVREPSTEADIWWGQGSPNYPMDERAFMLNR